MTTLEIKAKLDDQFRDTQTAILQLADSPVSRSRLIHSTISYWQGYITRDKEIDATNDKAKQSVFWKWANQMETLN